MDELTRTLRDGFTAAELAAAKKSLHDERVGGRSSDAGLLGLISAREQFSRTLAWDEQLDAKLAALTLDQVNAAFRRNINPAKRFHRQGRRLQSREGISVVFQLENRPTQMAQARVVCQF